MAQTFKSQAGKSSGISSGINGSYDHPQSYGNSYVNSSSLSLLHGIEEQLKESQEKIITIVTRNESPWKRKLYSALCSLGFSSPEQRSREKISELEQTLARFDLSISRHESAVNGYMKETQELAKEKNTVGIDCIKLDEILDRFTEEYAKLEEDEKKIRSQLQGNPGKREAHSFSLELQKIEEEKRNLNYDIANTQNELSNAMEVYETAASRLEVRNDQYTEKEFSLRNLRDLRRDLFKTTEYLKLYAENNPLTSVIGVVQLMQEGTAKTQIGDEILNVYYGLHREAASAMESVPSHKKKEDKSRSELYNGLQEKNKVARAERMREIRERLYRGVLAGGMPFYDAGNNGTPSLSLTPKT